MTDCTNEVTDLGPGATIVGTCCCGGYGVVLHEGAAEEEGRCHIPLDEYTEGETDG